MPEGFDYSRLFFDRYYRPENCVILIAGDFDPRQAQRWCGALRAVEARRPAAADPCGAAPRRAGARRHRLARAGAADPGRLLPHPAYSAQDRTAGGAHSPARAGLRRPRRSTGPSSRGADSSNRSRPPSTCSATYLFTVTAQLKDAAGFANVESKILSALDEAAAFRSIPSGSRGAKRRWEASLLLSLENPGGWPGGSRLPVASGRSARPRPARGEYPGRDAGGSDGSARSYLIPAQSITLTLVGRSEAMKRSFLPAQGALAGSHALGTAARGRPT